MGKAIVPVLGLALGVAMVLISSRTVLRPLYPPTKPTSRGAPRPALSVGGPGDVALHGVAWDLIHTGHLREAQDEFLRLLTLNPRDGDALQGLATVRRYMAGDDVALLKRQASAYEKAIRRGTAIGEYDSQETLKLLLAASIKAFREIEIKGMNAGSTNQRARETHQPHTAPGTGEAVSSPGLPAVQRSAGASPGPATPAPSAPVRRPVPPVALQPAYEADVPKGTATQAAHGPAMTETRAPQISKGPEAAVVPAKSAPAPAPRQPEPTPPAAAGHPGPVASSNVKPAGPPPAPAHTPAASRPAPSTPGTPPATTTPAAAAQAPRTPPVPEAQAAPPPSPPASPLPKPSAMPPPAPQATPAASEAAGSAQNNRQYMLHIGPISDRDRASAVARQLSVGGFSSPNVTSRTGFQVLSEPIPRSAADSLVVTMAAHGIQCQIQALRGDTVQLVFGSFTTQRDAEALAQRINGQGYDAWVHEATVYSLQLGPYPQSAVGAITSIVKSGAPEAVIAAEAVP